MPQDEKKSGVEALKAVLQEMVNQANWAADDITKAAEENIAVPLHDISKTAGAGKNLSDDPKKTIKAFVDKNYNSILEGCGLPSAKKSEALRGRLEKFQEKLIVQRRLDAGLDYGDPRGVAYDAKNSRRRSRKRTYGQNRQRATGPLTFCAFYLARRRAPPMRLLPMRRSRRQS